MYAVRIRFGHAYKKFLYPQKGVKGPLSLQCRSFTKKRGASCLSVLVLRNASLCWHGSSEASGDADHVWTKSILAWKQRSLREPFPFAVHFLKRPSRMSITDFLGFSYVRDPQVKPTELPAPLSSSRHCDQLRAPPPTGPCSPPTSPPPCIFSWLWRYENSIPSSTA